MEIKSCEEYVLDRLHETERKLDEADRNCEILMNKVDSLNQIIHTYEDIVLKYGELQKFDTFNMFSVIVSGASYVNSDERQAFDMLVQKFPEVRVNDLTRRASEES
jgi:hypothetical protein